MRRSTGKVFKALSDPNRIRILKMLEGKDLCVCEVREILGLSISTVSKHLSVLRDAGLILDAKEGKWVNYMLNDGGEEALVRGLLRLMKKSFTLEEQVRADRQKLLTAACGDTSFSSRSISAQCFKTESASLSRRKLETACSSSLTALTSTPQIRMASSVVSCILNR